MNKLTVNVEEAFEAEESMAGILIIVREKKVDFMEINPEEAPVIELDGEQWSVTSLCAEGDEEVWDEIVVELNLQNGDKKKQIRLTSETIGEENAFILLNAVFSIYNNEEELGMEYKDIHDFYGLELS